MRSWIGNYRPWIIHEFGQRPTDRALCYLKQNTNYLQWSSSSMIPQTPWCLTLLWHRHLSSNSFKPYGHRTDSKKRLNADECMHEILHILLIYRKLYFSFITTNNSILSTPWIFNESNELVLNWSCFWSSALSTLSVILKYPSDLKQWFLFRELFQTQTVS